MRDLAFDFVSRTTPLKRSEPSRSLCYSSEHEHPVGHHPSCFRKFSSIPDRSDELVPLEDRRSGPFLIRNMTLKPIGLYVTVTGISIQPTVQLAAMFNSKSSTAGNSGGTEKQVSKD